MLLCHQKVVNSLIQFLSMLNTMHRGGYQPNFILPAIHEEVFCISSFSFNALNLLSRIMSRKRFLSVSTLETFVFLK